MTEKNFEYVTFDKWYLQRNGQIFHLNEIEDIDQTRPCWWDEEGKHSEDSRYDFVACITQPKFELTPMPKKKVVKAPFYYATQDGNVSLYPICKTKEDAYGFCKEGMGKYELFRWPAFPGSEIECEE